MCALLRGMEVVEEASKTRKRDGEIDLSVPPIEMLRRDEYDGWVRVSGGEAEDLASFLCIAEFQLAQPSIGELISRRGKAA